jgi:hypothetical protein
MEPYAEAFRATLAAVGVEPAEPVIVGDRLRNDASGAQAFGCDRPPRRSSGRGSCPPPTWSRSRAGRADRRLASASVTVTIATSGWASEPAACRAGLMAALICGPTIPCSASLPGPFARDKYLDRRVVGSHPRVSSLRLVPKTSPETAELEPLPAQQPPSIAPGALPKSARAPQATSLAGLRTPLQWTPPHLRGADGPRDQLRRQRQPRDPWAAELPVHAGRLRPRHPRSERRGPGAPVDPRPAEPLGAAHYPDTEDIPCPPMHMVRFADQAPSWQSSQAREVGFLRWLVTYVRGGFHR